MKIAIVHLDYSTYFVDRLLSFQKNIKETDSVYIIEVLGTSPLYPFMKVQKNNLNNYECLFPKSTYDNIEAKKIYKAVVERLNIINPDVVFSGPIAFPSSAAALFWAKKHNRGIVLFDDCHKDTFERSKLNTYVKIKLFENVDAFLCPSEDYLETMLDFGFTPDQIYYGLNVVNNEFWWNTESEYCSDFDNSYFITVGRQVPGKNLISLVKAYNKYKAEGGLIPLLMVGDGPVHKEILEIASNDCDIKFLGFQTPENIKKLYKNARALLLPSYKTETWGLVVNEAMCSRRCVAISTEVGCANTLVQENRNGYLFDPRNIDSIKDTLFKIERLSYDEISSFGNNSQEIIKEWTLEKFSKNLYKALCFAEKQKKHGDMVSRILCQIWKGKLNEMEKV